MDPDQALNMAEEFIQGRPVWFNLDVLYEVMGSLISQLRESRNALHSEVTMVDLVAAERDIAQHELEQLRKASIESMKIERERVRKLEERMEKLELKTKNIIEWREMYHAAKGRAESLRTALQEIASIKNEVTGGDWDEIERARVIARNALIGGENEK